ncbi:hypothetical protein WJX82_002050 [Trebouxia sp. C0006]
MLPKSSQYLCQFGSQRFLSGTLQIAFRCLPSKATVVDKISAPLYQQPFAQQSFASSSDTNSEIDQALAKATESHDAHKLLDVVEKYGKEFRESDVISTFTSIANWEHSSGNSDVLHSKPFQTLVDMVIMGLKRFSNQELTDVIKAAGTLQFDDDMLLDRTSQQLMLSVHKMSADELFNLATGLAELEHSPSVILFDSIQERAGKISGDFTPEQKQGLEKAYQRLEYDHDTISKELPDK